MMRKVSGRSPSAAEPLSVVVQGAFAGGAVDGGPPAAAYNVALPVDASLPPTGTIGTGTIGAAVCKIVLAYVRSVWCRLAIVPYLGLYAMESDARLAEFA